MNTGLIYRNAIWFKTTVLMLVVMLLSLALPVGFAAAAPLTALAPDGAGSMSVGPTSVVYGSSGLIFTFTFTADSGDMPAGSQVILTTPAGWPAPSGHISVTNKTCALQAPVIANFAGSTVNIDMGCAQGQSFTVKYFGVTAAAVVSGSPYTFLTQTDITNGNGIFDLTSGSPAVTVMPKPLTVSASGLTPANKIYDGNTSATLTLGSPTLVGIVPGDTVTLIKTGAIGTFNNRNAGVNKPVNITKLFLGGTSAGNYTLVNPIRRAAITVKPITVTAVANTKVYDGSTASTGIPVISTALASADTPAFTQTFDTRDIGTAKTLTPAGKVVDGNGGANYVVTFVPKKLGIITTKPITVTAITDTRVYNGTTSSSKRPSIFPGLAGTDTTGFTQTFNNKNVGSGKTLTPAGIVNDGNGGHNYKVSFAAPISTGVILARPLSVSGITVVNKVYDGKTTAALIIGSPFLVGVVSPDIVTLLTSGATGSFADKNVGVGKAVTISGLTLSGLGAGNYTLPKPVRTASISKRLLTVTAVTDNKPYDGTTTSSGVPLLTAGTIVAGDIAPVWVQTFNNKNAGSLKTLTPFGTVTDGNSGHNYAYIFTPNTTGVITKRALTITAVTDSKTYDGTTLSSGLPALTSGSIAPGDSEPVWSQTFSTKHVGTGKSLNPAGKVIDGNAGNNYAYTFTPDTTGQITAKTITVTAVTATKFYDGTVNSAVLPLISPGLAGTDTSGFTQTFDSKDIGTTKTLTPAGSVIDGNSGADYSVTFSQVTTGVINAKPITVSADYKTKALNAPDPALTYRVSPALVAGDFFSGTLARDPGEASGIYAIKQNTLTAGSNYAITYVGANLMIGPSISGSTGLGGVKLSYTDGVLKSVLSAPNGSYTLIVHSGWSGSVTASLAGYVFTPPSIAYVNVTANLTGKNYAASKERAKNGGFNTYVGLSKVPQYWAASGFALTDGKDLTIKQEGTASVKITGAAAVTKTLTQTLALSGLSGDKFVFSFWARGLLVPAAGVCQAQVLLYSGTVLKATKTIICSNGTYAFQKKALSFTATSAYTQVVIKITYAKSSGTLWFDAVSLMR